MSQDQRVEGLIGAPRRYIFNDADMQRFRQSQAKEELLRVTEAMGKACSSCSLYFYNPEDPLNGLTPSIASLHGSLTGMLQWLLDFPPSNRSQARFGNPMFRMWHKRLVERSVNVVYTILRVQKEYPGRGNFNKEVLQSASKRGLAAIDQVKEIESITEQNDRDIVIELIAYFQAAFGHEVRLDYGTGHECSFQVFLFVLCKLGCFGSTTDVPPSAEHLKATTISIWSAYLSLTRQVQTDYMLEPAGSHGVWGLDDYHCLPFYFGACQMQSDGLDYRPDSIHDNSLLERERNSLLYFGCIRYIKSLKKGAPFYEHSPMLNDISNLLSWAKVASGLLRLFEGEVLDKRQVVQHFVFKNLFTADWNPSQTYGQKAPSETFRSLAVAVPLARTPKADCEGGESDMAPTKAPWAKN